MALAAVSPCLIPKCQSRSLPSHTFVHRRSSVEVFLSISQSESADVASSKLSSHSCSSFSSYKVSFTELDRKSITANSNEASQVEETDSKIQVVALGVAWASLRFLDEKTKKSPVSRIDVLSQLGQIGTRSFMLAPPKAYSVDRFFHPDITNVSENLKEELKRARDEFKMHETDCGSSQVQIAMLSVKIRYLSAVIPKKDKQSLRGLNEMVVLRRSLLRYLRRTKWDTYCDVISRLGLADNVIDDKRKRS